MLAMMHPANFLHPFGPPSAISDRKMSDASPPSAGEVKPPVDQAESPGESNVQQGGNHGVFQWSAAPTESGGKNSEHNHSFSSQGSPPNGPNNAAAANYYCGYGADQRSAAAAMKFWPGYDWNAAAGGTTASEMYHTLAHHHHQAAAAAAWPYSAAYHHGAHGAAAVAAYDRMGAFQVKISEKHFNSKIFGARK